MGHHHYAKKIQGIWLFVGLFGDPWLFNIYSFSGNNSLSLQLFCLISLLLSDLGEWFLDVLVLFHAYEVNFHNIFLKFCFTKEPTSTTMSYIKVWAYLDCRIRICIRHWKYLYACLFWIFLKAFNFQNCYCKPTYPGCS